MSELSFEPLVPTASSQPAVPHYHTDTWIHDLQQFIGTCTLCELRMLGTHNSATYGISAESAFTPERMSLDRLWAKKTAREITAKWSKCQNRTVYEQLCDGVRYIDLRLAPCNMNDVSLPLLWVVHGMYSVPLRNVFEDILRFFTSDVSPNCSCGRQPTESTRSLEVVVIDVQRLLEWDGVGVAPILDAEFAREMKILEPLIAAPPLGPTSKMCEFWGDRCGASSSLSRSSRNNVVLLYASAPLVAASPLLHHRNDTTIRSPWFGEDSTTNLLHRIGADLSHCCVTWLPSSPQVLGVMQSILTPTASDIAKGVLSPLSSTPTCILDYAHRINSKGLRSWIQYQMEHDRQHANDQRGPPRFHANILLLDFYEVGTAEFVLVPSFEGNASMNAARACIEMNIMKFFRCVPQ